MYLIGRLHSFWATVCKTVRPMLSDRCLSCPVCPVCLWRSRIHVYCSYCDFVRALHNAQSLLVCSSSSSNFSILCILFL